MPTKQLVFDASYTLYHTISAFQIKKKKILNTCLSHHRDNIEIENPSTCVNLSPGQ